MYIKARVKTGAKRASLKVVSPSVFEVSVREKPERNQANARVIALVAAHLKVPAKNVRIVRGQHSPSKMLLILTDATSPT